MAFNHKDFESKWQQKWAAAQIYAATDDSPKEKFYLLVEFPYPSGDGLHVGHCRSYTALDIVARKKRMEGKNVLFPIGFDAFGLPTENFAIKNKIQPRVATDKNIANFTKQLKSIGFSFDWNRVVDTTDPKYYKWTQFIFLKFFEKGLAYQAEIPINWCLSCKIGLANEEVVDGKCERCGGKIERRVKKQWMLAITKYAQKLLDGLETVDFLPRIKIQQQNWIGKSVGAEVDFEISDQNKKRRFRITAEAGCHSIGDLARNTPLFDDLILSQKISVVKRKRFSRKTEKRFNQTCETANRKINLHRGKIVQHFRKKEPQERRFRLQFFATVWHALPDLFFESETVGYFRCKNSIFRVILNKKNDSNTFEVKTFYRCKQLSCEFVENSKNLNQIKVFTTRPDTLFGATYTVLAPEHELLQKLKPQIKNWAEVEKYLKAAAAKSDLERTELAKEKTGVELKGVRAINPVNDEEIPIFVADYVLAGYGTGAIMAVPAHDERDFEFATKFGIEIREVVEAPKGSAEKCFTGEGVAKNSGEFDGLSTAEFKQKIIAFLEKKGAGKAAVNFKLRDWIFSRQRYWGEPIPIVHCPKCGAVPAVADFAKYEKNEGDAQPEETSSGGDTYVRRVNPSSGRILASSAFKCKSQFTAKFNNKKIKIISKEVGEIKFNWESLRRHFRSKSFTEFLVRTRLTKAVVETLENFDYCSKIIINENLIVCNSRCGNRVLTVVLGKVKKCWLVKTFYQSRRLSKIWKKLTEKFSLPLKLPEVENYEPTETGESPLAGIEKWVNVDCPKCGNSAKRETDTMPNWAGSSWYFLRYADPQNSREFAAPEKLKKWLPVDLYNGGMEHTVLHLLYSRFWHKFLFDLNLVPTAEPYTKRISHGMILGPDGEKMSKSRGNVVNPDEIVAKFGADTLRLYEMFIGPFDQAVAWNEGGVAGVRKFLEKVWRLSEKPLDKIRANGTCETGMKKEIRTLAHKTIKKVSEDLEKFHFNTAVSSLMIFVNELQKLKKLPKKTFEKFLRILAPFAPHLAEELWEKLGNKNFIHLEKWPAFDEDLAKDETIILAISVNGKLRDTISVAVDIGKDEALKLARKSEKLQKWLEGKEIKKEIFVPGKMINFVIE